jgi:hypothetical protein
MKKDRIYAFVGFKPKGRGSNRYWEAFSFSSNANQNDVEAFMVDIHISSNHYFLHMESQLKRVKPYKGSYSQYFIKSEKYGEVWVYATRVGFTWEWRKEDGATVKHRLFKVR